MADSGNSKESEEILYWGLAIVGLLGLQQVWKRTIRPWIESTWGELRAGELADIPVIGPVDSADLIGLAALLVPVALVLAFVVSKVKRRRRARARNTAPAEAN